MGIIDQGTVFLKEIHIKEHTLQTKTIDVETQYCNCKKNTVTKET